MAGTERAVAPQVEAMDSYEPVFGFYEQLVDLYGDIIDDVTDMDNEDCLEYSYLISLNRDRVKLSSEKLDQLLEVEDAYFFNVCVSREKPLATGSYWKYPQEGRGQELLVSELPYLQEQAYADELFQCFARQQGLLTLSAVELEQEVLLDGETVSIYYKYFNRTQ